EVEVRDVSGCSSTLVVTVSFLEDCSSLNIRIENDSICAGEMGMLTAIVSGGDGNYTYSWTGGNLQGATGSSIQEAPATSTQYKLVVTDGSGVTDSALASIIVNNPPQAAFTTNSACVGQITAFQNQSSGATNYQWNFGNGNSSRDADPQQKYSFPGDFWVRLIATDDLGCADSVVQQVVVNFVPDIDFVADSTAACPDLTTNFVNLSDSLDPGFIYLWDLGDGSTNSLSGNFSHTYTSPGLYDVSLFITTPQGCRDSLTKIGYIELYPIPEASFYADPAVSNMLNPRISFINTSTDATNFIWDFGDGNTSLEEAPEHVYADTGTYQVFLEVQNDGGCRDTFSTEVMIQDFLTFYAPTAFTPNGDGNNDRFEPRGNFIDPESLDLFIFNRWGNLIFESRGYPVSWDGTSKGKAVPMGTYVWRVVLRDQNNRPREYAGSVTVLR
ncbi:MAG: PKD domain-containing protein, partial [Bacteroidota bacterium]